MKVLFLCTANSCRSILSEALFNHLAPPGLRAWSAGSHPAGVVNPLTLRTLAQAGVATAGLHSKSMDALATLAPDVVITVCDKAAGEACPLYFGQALKAHWGLEDPSGADGTPESVEAAFTDTLRHIRQRIQAFLALPLPTLPPAQLQAELDRIGRL